MLCLSMWQPWASLLVHGIKRIETRSWAWRRPMPTIVAIHAAKKWDHALMNLCLYDPTIRDGLEQLQDRGCQHKPHGNGLPRGGVIGIVTFSACWQSTDFNDLTDQERALGDFSPGRHGFFVAKYMPLPEMIPLRGMQGIWNWDCPPELEQQYASILPD